MLWCESTQLDAKQSFQSLTVHALPWMLRLLAFDLVLCDDDTDEDDATTEAARGLEKLQRGAMDCVACLCKASHVLLSSNLTVLKISRPPLVVDMTDAAKESSNEEAEGAKGAETVQNVTSLVLGLLCGDIHLSDIINTLWLKHPENFVSNTVFRLESSRTLRVCAANILINSMKMWLPTHPSTPVTNQKNEIEIKNMPSIQDNSLDKNEDEILKTSMLSIILRTLTMACTEQIDMDPVVRGAAIQVIFIGLHTHPAKNIESSVSVQRLHSLAMGACQDVASSAVRMSGLKLLGMMIGKIPEIFSKTLPGAGGHTKSVVSQLANIDESREVREMANNIRQAVFG